VGTAIVTEAVRALRSVEGTSPEVVERFVTLMARLEGDA
jgi:hypothetical protein